MAFNNIRDRRQTSRWGSPSPPPLPTPLIQASYQTLKRYFGHERDHTEDEIRAELGIPCRQAYSPRERVLEGYRVVLVLKNENQRSYYWIEGYKVKVDTKIKKREFLKKEAQEEKKVLEEFVLWKRGARYLQNFVAELGGTLKVISEPKIFLDPSSLHFIMTHGADGTVPRSQVSLGATLHANVQKFIERQLSELEKIREKSVTPFSADSEEEVGLSELDVTTSEDGANDETSDEEGEDVSGNDGLEESIVDGVSTPVVSPAPSPTPTPTPTPTRSATPVPATSSSAPPITPIHSPPPAANDVAHEGPTSEGPGKDEEIHRGVVKNAKKRVVSEEKARDIEVEHSPKKGREE